MTAGALLDFRSHPNIGARTSAQTTDLSSIEAEPKPFYDTQAYGFVSAATGF
jgi:hypothetical protein